MEHSENISSDKTTAAAILPLAYFPPIKYFQLMFQYEQTIFDLHEHFHKQFYYNRCLIGSPNGVLKLSIPILHRHKRVAVKDVRISYEHNWRILHWRSLEAAYRRSPYFEFYEHYFTSIFSDFKPVFLFEWNMKLMEVINKILGDKLKFSFTSEYKESYNNTTDYRSFASPLILAAEPLKTKKYHQVFEERQGFINNLGIIDLLFCEGNEAQQYLM
jgi:hypothetical protein